MTNRRTIRTAGPAAALAALGVALSVSAQSPTTPAPTGKCPVTGATLPAAAAPAAQPADGPKAPGQDTTVAGPYGNRDWWPNQLDLRILHQNPPAGNPMGPAFRYAEEFKKIDLDALKKD